MINLDSNIVAVSLRSISHSLDADFTAIEWVIGAYTLTFASLVLPAGSLADRYGRKRMLIAGLAIFSLASFFCGAAPNILVLDVARAFQGVGAALQLSSSLAILSHRFQGAARGRAFAFWGAMTGMAIAAGPVAGGLITQHFGWERAFYVNPIIGVATIALTLTSVVESKDPNATRIDLPGLMTFSSFLFLITLALIRGNHKGWDSTEVQSEFAAAAALFVIFIFVELRQELPMLDLSFFRNPTFVGANLAGIVLRGLSFDDVDVPSDLFPGWSRLRRAGRGLAHAASGDPDDRGSAHSRFVSIYGADATDWWTGDPQRRSAPDGTRGSALPLCRYAGGNDARRHRRWSVEQRGSQGRNHGHTAGAGGNGVGNVRDHSFQWRRDRLRGTRRDSGLAHFLDRGSATPPADG